MSDDVSDWTLVIPVKGTPSAKSRLGGPPELALAIALDSVEAAVGAARVIVVTSPDLRAHFLALGAEVIDDAGRGLIAACRQGIGAAGPARVAVMLGDLPTLRSADLRKALEAAKGYPRAFIPDADNEGTTIITAIDAAQHAPAFGESSRAAHLKAGYAELPWPRASGLRRDVDTPEQLAALPLESLGGRTRVVVEQLRAVLVEQLSAGERLSSPGSR